MRRCCRRSLPGVRIAADLQVGLGGDQLVDPRPPLCIRALGAEQGSPGHGGIPTDAVQLVGFVHIGAAAGFQLRQDRPDQDGCADRIPGGAGIHEQGWGRVPPEHLQGPQHLHQAVPVGPHAPVQVRLPGVEFHKPLAPGVR